MEASRFVYDSARARRGRRDLGLVRGAGDGGALSSNGRFIRFSVRNLDLPESKEDDGKRGKEKNKKLTHRPRQLINPGWNAGPGKTLGCTSPIKRVRPDWTRTRVRSSPDDTCPETAQIKTGDFVHLRGTRLSSPSKRMAVCKADNRIRQSRVSAAKKRIHFRNLLSEIEEEIAKAELEVLEAKKKKRADHLDSEISTAAANRLPKPRSDVVPQAPAEPSPLSRPVECNTFRIIFHNASESKCAAFQNMMWATCSRVVDCIRDFIFDVCVDDDPSSSGEAVEYESRATGLRSAHPCFSLKKSENYFLVRLGKILCRAVVPEKSWNRLLLSHVPVTWAQIIDTMEWIEMTASAKKIQRSFRRVRSAFNEAHERKRTAHFRNHWAWRWGSETLATFLSRKLRIKIPQQQAITGKEMLGMLYDPALRAQLIETVPSAIHRSRILRAFSQRSSRVKKK